MKEEDEEMSALTAAMEKLKEEEEQKRSTTNPSGAQSQSTNDLGIPTMDQCIKIMVEQGVKPNIIEHSQKVAYVARNILGFLNSSSSVDGNLVTAGALLHDIAKTRCLETHEDHAIVGAEMVTKLGYPQLATIVREHGNIDSFNKDGPLTPQEIVCYADKRVMHTEIVSLIGRKIDIYARYGSTSADKGREIEKTFEKYGELEKKIKSSITCDICQIIPDNTVDTVFRWEYEGYKVKIAGNFTSWVPVNMPNKEYHIKLPPVNKINAYYYLLIHNLLLFIIFIL